MKEVKHDIVETILAQLGNPVVSFEYVYEPNDIKDAFGHFDMEVVPTGSRFEFICTPKGHILTIDAPKRSRDSESPDVAPIYQGARDVLQAKGWTLNPDYDRMTKPGNKSALYVFFVRGKEPGSSEEKMYAIKVFPSRDAYDKELKLFQSKKTDALRQRLRQIKKLAPRSVDIIVPKDYSSEKALFAVMDAASGKTMLDLQLYFLASLKKDFLPKKISGPSKILANGYSANKDKLTGENLANKYVEDYSNKVIAVMDDMDTELVTTFRKTIQTYGSQAGYLCAQFDGANWHMANNTDSNALVYSEPDPTNIVHDAKQKQVFITNFDGITMSDPLYNDKGELFIRSLIVFPDNRAIRPLFTIPVAGVNKSNITLLVYLLYIGALEQFRSYRKSLQEFSDTLKDKAFTEFMNNTARPRLENMFSATMESIRKVLLLS